MIFTNVNRTKGKEKEDNERKDVPNLTSLSHDYSDHLVDVTDDKIPH